MSVHDLCCIGYITQDKIVTTKNTIYMPGGTSFYFAHAIKHLDPNGFLLVTSLAHTEMNVVEDIRKEGIEVKALPSARSVCFENIYGENQNERTQRVTAKADPFTMEGLQDVNARIIHLGSLLADDFSLDVIKYLSGKGLLSVDVQGFLRKVDNEKVLPVDWPEKREALKHIHILKANETEMEVLTGCKEPHEAALLIASKSAADCRQHRKAIPKLRALSHIQRPVLETQSGRLHNTRGSTLGFKSAQSEIPSTGGRHARG